MGCRTVAITGGSVKTQLCREQFSFDVAIDHKAGGKLADPIAASCHRGVDVYFDNTARAISNAALAQLAIGGHERSRKVKHTKGALSA